MFRWFLLTLVGCAAVMACNKTPKTPPVNINGNERIGWDQQATDTAQVASWGYVIYVDGARSELSDASCADTAGPAGFACTAALPQMAKGVHTLQLATFVWSNGAVLESPRSAPLLVNVLGAGSTGARPGRVIGITGTSSDQSSSALPSGQSSSTFPAGQASSNFPSGIVATTSDRVALRVDLVVDGLDQPTGVAFAPDGRIFIAERAGHLRVVTDGRLQQQPALTLDDVVKAGDGGLVALVLDSQFDRTHFVYMVYTRLARSGGSTFCLARFREANGTLGERVVLLDNISASPVRPTASLRFGPDGKLYAAFDDGGDVQRAGDMGSFNGKILRLNPDGTTPDDQAGYTPVYASDYRSPRGFDWQPGTGMLWIADGDSEVSMRLEAVDSVNDRMKRGAVKARYALPPPSTASALSFYSAELIPAFRDNLLVADDTGGDLLRIRFNAQDPTRILAMERLLQDRVGAIRVVSAPSDGAIYICTAHALARMTPASTIQMVR